MKKSSKLLIGLGAVILVGALVYSFFARPVIAPVELSQEQRKDYEEKVQFYSAKLLTEVDESDELKRPRLDDFIEKARYQSYLGRLSDAERTLKESLRQYEVSSVSMHNLAKLYEQMKRWDKAFTTYQILVNEYQRPEYELDMARMARQMNDVKLASKHYWSFQRQFKNPSAEFEQWLRDKKVK